MYILLPVKPSELVNRIVTLRLEKQTAEVEEQIVQLIEREVDLCTPVRFGGITSPSFRCFIENLSILKTALMEAHRSLSNAKTRLYALTLEDRTECIVRTISDVKQHEASIGHYKKQIDEMFRV